MQLKSTTHYETPHLTTANTGPLHLLEKQILANESAIEAWFEQQWQHSPAPVYGSVDLRNAGFKLAPVDMNLFPAGFNNLNPEFLPLGVKAAQHKLAQVAPGAKRIILIPESHTRNLFYWTSVKALLAILTGAGFEVRIGSLLPEITKVFEIELADGSKVHLEPFERRGDLACIGDFVPDILLLNNDLSEGIPEILQGLQQPIVPPSELGWSQRLKSGHFQHYAEICDEFAKFIAIDPWVIAPLFRHCGKVNFMNREGEECLKHHVETLLHMISDKYAEYGITQDPYIIVKADAGTYGMAVMTVHSVEELLTLNRKQRSNMSKSKGGQPVSRVIVQEGVYTFETWGPEQAVAEPVVYMLGEHVIGGFYRVHKERGIDENLNSPGMKFEPLAFEKTCHQAKAATPQDCQNRFYAYGVVARLSMLAAAREMQAVAAPATN